MEIHGKHNERQVSLGSISIYMGPVPPRETMGGCPVSAAPAGTFQDHGGHCPQPWQGQAATCAGLRDAR